MGSPLTGAQHEFRPDLLAETTRKIGSGSIVDRHGQHAGTGAAQKRCHPFRAVGAPEKDRVAFHDIADGKKISELAGGCGDALVGPALMAISARKDVSGLIAPSFEIVEIVQ